MAAIALPQLKLPQLGLGALKGLGSGVTGVLRKPAVGLVLAALAFAAVVILLIRLLGPLGGETHHKIALGPILKSAPAGWLQALKPLQGAPRTISDVVRLTERPMAAEAARRPPAPVGAAFAGGPLPPAPIAGFYAPGHSGPLPIIAQDGRTPAEAYARPFAANGRPKVALIVRGLGLNERTTRQAIETLRPEVTLSFVVYADGLQGWIDMARARGHEVLLETPMEPENFPDNDPGPYALLASGQPAETIKRLEWILSRATGYFGLTNYLGARFLATGPAYDAFATSARGRGLAFIDDGLAADKGGGLPRATPERQIDGKLDGAAIDQQLAALEAGAQQRGQALGMGLPYPVTLEKVAEWANSVETRGYQLAPASSMTAKR